MEYKTRSTARKPVLAIVCTFIPTEDGRVVDFDEIIDIDPALSNVINLKRGQTAVRESQESEWKFL